MRGAGAFWEGLYENLLGREGVGEIFRGLSKDVEKTSAQLKKVHSSYHRNLVLV